MDAPDTHAPPVEDDKPQAMEEEEQEKEGDTITPFSPPPPPPPPVAPLPVAAEGLSTKMRKTLEHADDAVMQRRQVPPPPPPPETSLLPFEWPKMSTPTAASKKEGGGAAPLLPKSAPLVLPMSVDLDQSKGVSEDRRAEKEGTRKSLLQSPEQPLVLAAALLAVVERSANEDGATGKKKSTMSVSTPVPALPLPCVDQPEASGTTTSSSDEQRLVIAERKALVAETSKPLPIKDGAFPPGVESTVLVRQGVGKDVARKKSVSDCATRVSIPGQDDDAPRYEVVKSRPKNFPPEEAAQSVYGRKPVSKDEVEGTPVVPSRQPAPETISKPLPIKEGAKGEKTGSSLKKTNLKFSEKAKSAAPADAGGVVPSRVEETTGICQPAHLKTGRTKEVQAALPFEEPLVDPTQKPLPSFPAPAVVAPLGGEEGRANELSEEEESALQPLGRGSAKDAPKLAAAAGGRFGTKSPSLFRAEEGRGILEPSVLQQGSSVVGSKISPPIGRLEMSCSSAVLDGSEIGLSEDIRKPPSPAGEAQAMDVDSPMSGYFEARSCGQQQESDKSTENGSDVASIESHGAVSSRAKTTALSEHVSIKIVQQQPVTKTKVATEDMDEADDGASVSTAATPSRDQVSAESIGIKTACQEGSEPAPLKDIPGTNKLAARAAVHASQKLPTIGGTNLAPLKTGTSSKVAPFTLPSQGVQIPTPDVTDCPLSSFKPARSLAVRGLYSGEPLTDQLRIGRWTEAAMNVHTPKEGDRLVNPGREVRVGSEPETGRDFGRQKLSGGIVLASATDAMLASTSADLLGSDVTSTPMERTGGSQPVIGLAAKARLPTIAGKIRTAALSMPTSAAAGEPPITNSLNLSPRTKATALDSVLNPDISTLTQPEPAPSLADRADSAQPRLPVTGSGASAQMTSVLAATFLAGRVFPASSTTSETFAPSPFATSAAHTAPSGSRLSTLNDSTDCGAVAAAGGEVRTRPDSTMQNQVQIPVAAVPRQQPSSPHLAPSTGEFSLFSANGGVAEEGGRLGRDPRASLAAVGIQPPIASPGWRPPTISARASSAATASLETEAMMHNGERRPSRSVMDETTAAGLTTGPIPLIARTPGERVGGVAGHGSSNPSGGYAPQPVPYGARAAARLQRFGGGASSAHRFNDRPSRVSFGDVLLPAVSSVVPG